MSVRRMPVRVRTAVALLVVAVAASAAGCGSSDDAQPAESATRTVQTAKGPVEIPADPQHIVVLNGALTGYLYDLGVKVKATDPRLLGVSLKPGEFPAAWSADATAQGTVAVPSGDDLNLEFIAAQRPDLIIGGGPGYPGKQSIDNYDKLTEIAPTALVPSDSIEWQDLLASVAGIVDRADKVPALLATFDVKVAMVKAGLRLPPGQASVMQSTADGRALLIAPNTPLATLLSTAGIPIDDKVEDKAGNPDRPPAADWVTFSPELLSIVVDAPVLFVISVSGGRTIPQLKEDPLMASLPSFQAGQVYELPATSLRPDYRSALATLDLLAEMFP